MQANVIADSSKCFAKGNGVTRTVDPGLAYSGRGGVHGAGISGIRSNPLPGDGGTVQRLLPTAF